MSTSDGAVILVVDDEEPIRMVARRVLEMEGYTVLEASNGIEALSHLSSSTEIDLLMADLEMPTMRGDDMVRRFRMRYPDMKVLYVSGYVDSLFAGQDVLWEGQAFLEKPVTARGLLEGVSLLLYGTVRQPKHSPKTIKPASIAPPVLK